MDRGGYGRQPMNQGYDSHMGHGGPHGGGPHGGLMQHSGAGPNQGQPQGSVLMVYGLNMEKINCERLFNLFCLYGNVVRVGNFLIRTSGLRSLFGSYKVQIKTESNQRLKNL